MTKTARIRRSFWIDRAAERPLHAPLQKHINADLLVVGGGFCGMWTALHAKQRHPEWHVVVLEGKKIGHAASGRNGGFVDPSLTHGLSHGLSRWPDDMEALVKLGDDNFAGMREDIRTLGIDCDWREDGLIDFARFEWEVEGLREEAEEARQYGYDATFYEGSDLSKVTKSPAFIAATKLPAQATVDPYRLVTGLANACEKLGVDIYEATIVDDVSAEGLSFGRSKDGRSVNVSAHANNAYLTKCAADSDDDDYAAGLRAAIGKTGSATASRVALATNVYPPLLRRLSLTIIPVYDHALMSEPLTDSQFEQIGWTDHAGLADSSNRFHYFRKTDDNRILWGGYDINYYYGSPRSERLTQHEETFQTLEKNFFWTYPQLEGIAFTHQWGGIIDSTTRFCMSVGTAAGGRIAYALGFTGLGVCATRFGADAMLDLLEGTETDRTACPLISHGKTPIPPIPFPPEPLRSAGIKLSYWSMIREDKTGKRNLWLRSLDKVGLGFDS